MIEEFPDPQGLPATAVDAQELEVLWGICHAFGATSDVDKLVPATIRWVREAIASPDAGVRLSLNRGKRLEVVGSEGVDAFPIGHGSTHSKRRRSVLNSKRSTISAVRSRPGFSLAALPLVSRGLCVGVIEIATTEERLRARWHTLEAIVSQVAILVRNLGDRNRLQQDISALEGSVDLVHQLLQASTPEEAVRSAVALAHDQHGAPAAACLYSDEKRCFELLATKGIQADAEQELAVLTRIPAWDEISGEHREKLERRFAQAAGSTRVEIFVSDRVILIAGIDAEHQSSGLRALSGLLFDALKNLSKVRLAETRNQTLDSAIGFAAHELKGPLVATKLLIDALRRTQSLDALMPALESSSKELSDLWGLVETLMEWSLGQPHLEVDDIPVVDLVGRAVDSVSDAGPCSLDARVDGDITVKGDDRQLRMAFSSLLRSALKHGSPHAVEVTVVTEGHNVVTRIRDQGPPIPPGSEDAMFDPFLRGRSMTPRSSKGLSLFVARRIVEAHGGRIVSEPSTSGASLRVELPLELEPSVT